MMFILVDKYPTMILELTRTNGDPVFVNFDQVLFYYPMGNGQTYLIFPCERYNLTVDEDTEEIQRRIAKTKPSVTRAIKREIAWLISLNVAPRA